MLNQFPSSEETANAIKQRMQRMNDKRARILVRASDYDWIDASPTAQEQLEILRNQAKSWGLKIVDEVVLHTSPHLSEFHYRNALLDLIEDARSNKYGVLMVTSLDRLSRSGILHMLQTVKEFEDADVIVVSLREKWLEGLTTITTEITHESPAPSGTGQMAAIRELLISFTAETTVIEDAKILAREDFHRSQADEMEAD